MGKFKELLMSSETLFKDERVFDRDYIPKDFNYRDSQLRSIAFCLRPMARGERAINAKIVGPPATGKTTAVKLMFDEIENMGEKAVCVHVNCQIHSSKFTVFSQIHKKVLGHLPPETGVPFPKVYEAIFKKLAKENKSLVVALDDINYLFYNTNEIIYDILRAHEVFPGTKTAIFGILSDVDFNYKLDAKVSSIFRPQEIFFQPYTLKEMIEILNDRAKLGFFPGVISYSVIKKVAEHAFAHTDLRVGIELLRVSALIAESEASRVIKESHVEKAYEKSKLTNLKHLLKSLGMEELELIRILLEEEGDSGTLYETFKEKTRQSYTKFYRILDKLESLRIIDTKFTGKGERGRTRNIFLRYEKNEIAELLKGIR